VYTAADAALERNTLGKRNESGDEMGKLRRLRKLEQRSQDEKDWRWSDRQHDVDKGAEGALKAVCRPDDPENDCDNVHCLPRTGPGDPIMAKLAHMQGAVTWVSLRSTVIILGTLKSV
jgi:hypothetical protein